MGLKSPCMVASSLALLEAAGIHIVKHQEAWFMETYHVIGGPYETPQVALEEGERLLAEQQALQIGGSVTTYGQRSGNRLF